MKRRWRNHNTLGLLIPCANRLIMPTLVAAIALGLTGCRNDSNTISYDYLSIMDNDWDRQDNISFSINKVAHSGNYNLFVLMRTTNEVPLQKIFVTVEQIFRHPQYYRKDTLCIALTDKYGNMQGKGLVLYNYKQPLHKPLFLRKGQHGIVKISHIMRRMQISGIKDIGIKLEHENSSY